MRGSGEHFLFGLTFLRRRVLAVSPELGRLGWPPMDPGLLTLHRPFSPEFRVLRFQTEVLFPGNFAPRCCLLLGGGVDWLIQGRSPVEPPHEQPQPAHPWIPPSPPIGEIRSDALGVRHGLESITASSRSQL